MLHKTPSKTLKANTITSHQQIRSSEPDQIRAKKHRIQEEEEEENAEGEDERRCVL
jgi:hypothetical protein